MFVKLLFLALAVVGSQGANTVQLPDQAVTHFSNPLIAKSISIQPANFFDELVSCTVFFPNGMMYELYPNKNTLPHASISSSAQTGHFYPACNLFFLDTPESMSGTYELLKLVKHTSDSTQTLYRQKFVVTIKSSDVEFPLEN